MKELADRKHQIQEILAYSMLKLLNKNETPNTKGVI